MLHTILGKLLLLAPPNAIQNDDSPIVQPVSVVLHGSSPEIISSPELLNKTILNQYPLKHLNSVLREYVDWMYGQMPAVNFQLVGVAYLQLFAQVNFTGPNVSSDQTLMFEGLDNLLVQLEALKLLSLEGQVPYDLVVNPVWLIMAELIFERLMEVPELLSLVSTGTIDNVDAITQYTHQFVEGHNDVEHASAYWWRSRLLQVHLALFSEPPGVLSAVCTLLLTPKTLSFFKDADEEIYTHLQISYFLENARFAIHGQTEHLAIPLLGNARKVSNLGLVLTGARAKRTKFQKFHTSNLILLAKSQISDYFGNDGQEVPESHDLNSDLLLERPHFESLEDVELPDQPNTKRIKFNPSEFDYDDTTEKLLPIAVKHEDIPAVLQDIDPNNQPSLNYLDSIQLLLRLTTLRQTSPSGNPLVEEELLALVSRILFTDTSNVNWTIFSRALWERSILETTKAKTIERGILQMTSLIEEIGIKVKTRLLPQLDDKELTQGASQVASRLRFIHQMTLMPQWTMDMKLAEKYMSVGVFRSALDIYERLELACEAALCYAAIDKEQEAENILIQRIKTHPEDARAISILGDIRQDPTLWEKAWEIGKYHKAKASLSKYYYAPPKDSGLTKNLELAIKHMNQSLQMNPLNYENWYFYGCCGLESAQFELASEAFTRCVSLDDTNSHAWSNLASALLRLDKPRPAFNALKKAIRAANENKRSWKIYENYMIVGMQLNEWNDVLIAVKELIEIKSETQGEGSIDLPVIEKLVEILISTEYPAGEGARFTHYQSSCIDLVCNMLPKVITTSSRTWRVVARVELWRKKPWDALECHERAYRAISSSPDLDTSEKVWNESVEACSDLCAAYESLGELPGKHDAGDVVCKDWKYKAKQTIRSLMSKGKDMWEDSEGWYTLQDLKSEYS